MKKLKPSTIRKLRRIQQAIRKEPRRLDMLGFLDNNSGIAPCGSAACIAGFALALSIGAPRWRVACLRAEQEVEHWPDEARDELGIDRDQAERLFLFEQHAVTIGNHCWPRIFESAYKDATGEADWIAAAEIAIARIEYFIQTGGK